MFKSKFVFFAICVALLIGAEKVGANDQSRVKFQFCQQRFAKLIRISCEGISELEIMIMAEYCCENQCETKKIIEKCQLSF
ncbi:hypothetical protein L5515_016286 [Caenorhabditis briggsae]|uniref:Uncharacterized protein n=1 Tax=Caenorhabditis briggsae TaxID=6238 RepID=A0AAE9JNE7_CAEBR|nr:hypothetical protein L5515_016286 [Caenorhabditis briggsae]